MSSDDDLVAKELRDRQEATEAVGTLRELERHCANATDLPEANLDPMRAVIDRKLQKAASLLGEGSDYISVIDYLGLLFREADHITYELIRQNVAHIAVVARALEDRFNLGSAGGPGGYNFSISDHPRVQWRTGHD